MKNKIKLVALDMDGTFFYPGETIAAEAKKAMENITSLGIKSVMIGGYHPTDLLREGITPQKGYFSIKVCNKKIWFLKNNKYIPLKEGNSPFKIPDGKEYHHKTKNLMQKFKEKMRGLNLSYFCMHPRALEFEKRDDSMRARDFIQEFVKHLMPIRVMRSIWYTGNKNHWKAIHTVSLESGMSKGRVLKKIVKILNFSPQEVLAMGDSGSDEDMLDGSFGFRSACPLNSDDEIKEAVRKNSGYVAKKPFGEGVSESLRIMKNGYKKI